MKKKKPYKGFPEQFKPGATNPHTFNLPRCGELTLIKAKDLKRGDVFRKEGGFYIVRNRDANTICFLNFMITQRQSGGGGFETTGYFGTKSQEIVEYIGVYEYKFDYKPRKTKLILD